jgi:hypothetical protein
MKVLLHRSRHRGSPHMHGVTEIQSAIQAVESLRPLAGELSFLVFGLEELSAQDYWWFRFWPVPQLTRWPKRSPRTRLRSTAQR